MGSILGTEGGLSLGTLASSHSSKHPRGNETETTDLAVGGSKSGTDEELPGCNSALVR